MMNFDPEKCTITRYPESVLAKTAEPITEIDETIVRLVDRMFEIMTEQNGIGLAGPQAGVALQIFIISLDQSREHMQVYINPKVETSGQVVTSEEGCLSVPGVFTNIRRYSNAKVTATDLNGKEFTDEADGLYARALQHEYDHLQGKTIVNRMSQTARIANRKKLKQLMERGE